MDEPPGYFVRNLLACGHPGGQGAYVPFVGAAAAAEHGQAEVLAQSPRPGGEGTASSNSTMRLPNH